MKAIIETANESRKARPTNAGPPASAPAAERTSSQMPTPPRAAMPAYQPSSPSSGRVASRRGSGSRPALRSTQAEAGPKRRGCSSTSPSGTSTSSQRRASPLPE